jgi:hypothetical protein
VQSDKNIIDYHARIVTVLNRLGGVRDSPRRIYMKRQVANCDTVLRLEQRSIYDGQELVSSRS